jgi:hypothetical protein
MSERSIPSTESKDQLTTKAKVARAAGAVVLVATAAAGIVYGAGVGGEKAEAARPAPAASASEAGTSPEVLVQETARKDAAAVVSAVGGLLAKTSGQTVASGRQFDNYGDNDAQKEEAPGLKVVRINEENLVTVQVSDTAREQDLTLQLYVANGDPMMSQPLDAATVTSGPDTSNIEIISWQHGGIDIHEDAGHLKSYSTGNPVALSASELDIAALSAGSLLEQVASELGQESPEAASQLLAR